jgi:transposase
MTEPTPQPAAAAATLVVGIDVAKDKLDLARSDSGRRVQTVANDHAGIAAVVGQLRPRFAELSVVVVEATGGLERPLVDALLEAGLPVAVVNPGHVRHLALGLGVLAKSDAIDAAVLVEFGRHAAPRLAERRSANQAELDALVTCRRQLAAARAQQANRRGATAGSKAALRAIDAVLAAFDKQVEALDRQIRTLIESDDDFRDADRILRSAPGVGPVASSTLIGELNELGRADRQQVAALAGVAPYNHGSGPRDGKRAIRGGRAHVRCVLYMATLTAIRCNPVIRAFAERLKAAGKAAKVVIVACMRKFLTLLNAMLRENKTWDQLDAVRNA